MKWNKQDNSKYYDVNKNLNTKQLASIVAK